VKKGVIFDFDGVLAQTNRIHLRSEQGVFRSLGLEISYGQLSQYFGMGVEHFIKAVLREHDLKANAKELVREKYSIMRGIIEREGLSEVPNAFGLAEKCRSSGFKVGVASGSSEEFIKYCLEKLGRKTDFDALVGEESVKKGKPAPEIFLRVAEILGVKPQNCTVIEDSGNGVKAAKKAGMKCIALRNSESGPQDLGKADRVVNSLREIKISEL